jgi:tetratricopeptide (TPR) repeat protein
MITQIPASVSKPTLRVVWEGEDNYTLPGDLAFEVQLDEEAADTVRGATTYRFDALRNGNHRLTITAIDEAGNRQTPPTTERFTVQVLPVPQFVTPRNGDLLNQPKILASWEGIHNCGPENPLLFSLKVDDREWTEYTEETSREIEDLEDGEHAFFLRAKDALENISEEGVNVRFEVDHTAPTCVAEELPRDWDGLDMPWPDLPDYKVEFRIVGNDNRTPGEDLEYRYRLDDKDLSEWQSVTQLTVFDELDDGLHRVAFETRDQALNIQTEPTTLNFEFNTPPNSRVWMDETISPPTYRFAAKDSNSDAGELSYRWRIDDGNWSDWTYDNEVIANSILGGVSHGRHSLFVQARDPNGNVDPSPAELVIDVDTIPPEPPTGLTLTAREDGAIVEIRWDEVSETGARYNVYRSKQDTFDRASSDLIDSLQRTRSADRPSRGEDTTTYYYYVTALDRSQNESKPGPPASVAVLGQKEIAENVFRELVGDVNDYIQLNQWPSVLEYSKNAPEPPPGFEGYPAYWSAIAQAEIALSQDPPSLQGLTTARTNFESFMSRYPNFEHMAVAEARFDRVKSQILWNRLLTYGKYAAYLVVALILIALVYKWIQNRRITEMPKITVTEGVEEITPSKEALKDPTVLRRWAEVQADPASAENWSRLAFAFHNIGEVGTAIQSLYKAMEIEPNNTRFHFQMGHFQKETGNLRESVRHFDRYLQLNPESKKSAEEVKELLVKLKAELGV